MHVTLPNLVKGLTTISVTEKIQYEGKKLLNVYKSYTVSIK